MKDTVLILTNSQDGEHSDAVVSKLKQRGYSFFRLDVDRLASGELKIKFFAGDGDFGFSVYSEGSVLKSQNVKSVWYRRPNEFNLAIQDAVQKEFAEDELSSFLEGLWLSLRNVFWINDPHKLERARKKIFQLKVAQEVGFRIPLTVVTNDPKEALALFEECDQGIIFKTMKRGFVEHGGKGFNIPTTLLTRDHLSKLELIKKLPSLFQEYIEKDYELRITVVGEDIFPVKIDSQSFPLTSVDWRRPEFIDKLRYTVVELPVEIKELCFAAMRSLGLQFGAFDLVVDKHGNHIFLEVNPNGQWYWLERLAGITVSDSLSQILTSGFDEGR